MSSTAALEVQLGGLEETREAAIVAKGDLAFQQQAEPVLEGEPFEVRHAQLLLQSLSHAGEAELVEAFERLLDQHALSPVLDAA